MKQFTVYDFIKYNSPCFNCKFPITFNFGCVNIYDNMGADLDNPRNILRPSVSKNQTEIDLKITYHNKLKLIIHHISNKFEVSSIYGLTNFLLRHKLYLSSRCENCYTLIESNFIDFNFKSEFIKPLTICRELLQINDDTNLYQIYSNFNAEQSRIIIDSISKIATSESLKLDVGLLPLYKFRTKEKLIKKIKLYTTFS